MGKKNKKKKQKQKNKKRKTILIIVDTFSSLIGLLTALITLILALRN